MRALLDVNVLIALHDSDHVHHGLASRWFQAHAGQGWASCPLTQNGCLRIMAQPGYQQPQPLRTLVAMLARSTCCLGLTASRARRSCPTANSARRGARNGRLQTL